MISLEKVDSSKQYVLLAGMALMISEHDTLREARTSLSQAFKEGHDELAIWKRTENGWQKIK